MKTAQVVISYDIILWFLLGSSAAYAEKLTIRTADIGTGGDEPEDHGPLCYHAPV